MEILIGKKRAISFDSPFNNQPSKIYDKFLTLKLPTMLFGT